MRALFQIGQTHRYRKHTYTRNELVESALWFLCESIRIVIARITSLSVSVIVAGLDDARFVSDRAKASLPQA